MKYKLRIDNDSINHTNHLNLRNIEIKDNKVSFTTNETGYNVLSQKINPDNIEILSTSTNKFKELIRKYLITIIGAFILIIFLINQSQTVTQIRFTNYDTYDQEIVDYMDKYMKKVGPFNYLNATLNDINLDLKNTFYKYEWIGVRKRGSILYLDIKKLDEYEDPSQDNTPGSLYANANGIIKMYHVENGTVLVQEEQYVSKGDMLISGDITHYGDKIEHSKAIGYVIAEVLEYQEFIIPKYQEYTIRTGKLEIAKELQLFNSKSKQKSKFPLYDIEEEIVFKLNKFFYIKRYYFYEIKNVKNYYTEEDAIRYGRSKVYNNFNLSKINDYEKIIYCNNINVIDMGDKYKVRFIVKTHQNISEFIPIIIEEDNS